MTFCFAIETRYFLVFLNKNECVLKTQSLPLLNAPNPCWTSLLRTLCVCNVPSWTKRHACTSRRGIRCEAGKVARRDDGFAVDDGPLQLLRRIVVVVVVVMELRREAGRAAGCDQADRATAESVAATSVVVMADGRVVGGDFLACEMSRPT